MTKALSSKPRDADDGRDADRTGRRLDESLDAPGDDRRTARALSELVDLLERSRDGDRRRAQAGSDSLAERLKQLEARLAERASAPNRDPEAARTPISVERLTQQLESARRDAAARADQQMITLREVESLRRDIEQLSRAIGDLAPRASVAAVEMALMDLVRHIDAQRERGVEGALLAPAERIVGELRAVIEDLDPSAIVRNLHADVQTIGRRLDALQEQAPADAATLRRLAVETGDIRAQLDALAARPMPFERIETRLADLTRRVDSLALVGEGASKALLAFDINELARSIRGIVAEETGARLDAFNRRLETSLPGGAPAIDELGERMKRLEARLSDNSGADTIARIEAMLARPAEDERLSELVQRVDSVQEALAEHVRAPQFDDIAARLERMQSTITERAERDARVAARQDELAGLVQQLASRLNAAAENTEPETLKALERQIGELSQRLDRRDPNGAALAAVEAKIGALVEQVESARSAAACAAEEAVRKATRDILLQANPAPGALRDMLARQLADLRADQDASAERTHETLRAVQETLERVVARLSTFEDELTEIRGSARVSAESAEVAADFVMSSAGRPGERREPPLRSAPGHERPVRPTEAGPMDFIAAARRAAQRAAVDAETLAEPSPHERVAEGPAQERDTTAPGDGWMAGIRVAVQERRRPLLLGLGALTLLLGAYQIARVGVEHAHKTPPRSETTPGPSRAAPKAAAPVARKAPAAPVVAPPPRMMSPRADTMPLDRETVGSIGASPVAGPTPAPDASMIIRARAELGDRSAQYEYGVRLLEGRGYARDQKLAAQWLEKAAAQNLAPAQYRLGSMYEKGVGVARDFERARQYYRAAADAGNSRAMHNLAVIYAEGGEEGRPDYSAAAEWFRKGAEYGVRDSQYNLAILYARGLGVEQNLVQSYLWFAAAAAQGDADSAKKRDDVGARLDSKDLASAEALASSFRAKTPPPAANEVEPPAGGWENAASGAVIPAPPPSPGPAAKPSKPKLSSL